MLALARPGPICPGGIQHVPDGCQPFCHCVESGFTSEVVVFKEDLLVGRLAARGAARRPVGTQRPTLAPHVQN